MKICLHEIKTSPSGMKMSFTFIIKGPTGTEVLFRTVGKNSIASSKSVDSLSPEKYLFDGSRQIVVFESREPEVHIYCLVALQGVFKLYNAQWIIKRGESDIHVCNLTSGDVDQIRSVLENGRKISAPLVLEFSEVQRSFCERVQNWKLSSGSMQRIFAVTSIIILLMGHLLGFLFFLIGSL